MMFAASLEIQTRRLNWNRAKHCNPQLTVKRNKISSATEVGAIILAAGASTRMGVPKQLLQFGSETMLRRAGRVAIEAGCRPVVVVTGADAAHSRKALRGLSVLEVENQRWESGMGSSICAGMEAIVAANPQIEAVIVMVCDQPFITRDIIAGLLGAHQETNCSIVASRYGRSYGVPALFGRTHFAELMKLKGTGGAKQIIQRHLGKVHLLPFPKGKIDVDTPEDWARLQQ
jgi:molybdenum cofactor cytidylyltransferase